MSHTNYDLVNHITPRELETLQLLVDCNGDYKAVAAKMVLEISTVKTHADKVFGKLGVTNRAGAVLEGLRRNLVTLNPTAPKPNALPEAQYIHPSTLLI